MSDKLSDQQIARRGALDALALPALALGCTMLGFGAIAREAGFDFWMTTFTTLSVWGMPGQIAFVGLYATGSSMFLMVVAVALANMRMMLMVISGADMLNLKQHKLPFYQRVFHHAFHGNHQLGTVELQAINISAASTSDLL